MTLYGVHFPKCPRYSSSKEDTSLLWMISAALTRVETLWRFVASSNLKVSGWHGWLLIYLTKNCFDFANRRQNRRDPYKYKYVSIIQTIREKLGVSNICEAFSNIHGVSCIDLVDEENMSLCRILRRNLIQLKNSRIIIFASYLEFGPVIRDWSYGIYIEPMKYGEKLIV